jgi:hypothetical protein
MTVEQSLKELDQEAARIAAGSANKNKKEERSLRRFAVVWLMREYGHWKQHYSDVVFARSWKLAVAKINPETLDWTENDWSVKNIISHGTLHETVEMLNAAIMKHATKGWVITELASFVDNKD